MLDSLREVSPKNALYILRDEWQELDSFCLKDGCVLLCFLRFWCPLEKLSEYRLTATGVGASGSV